MNATRDALALELVDELVEPEVDGNDARAAGDLKGGAMRAVKLPFNRHHVASGITRGRCEVRGRLGRLGISG